MTASIHTIAALSIVAACVGLPLTGAQAQDAQYWNLHYGTHGELMSGVMVGSALDLSTTFYNPGAFSRVADPSVLLTGSVFEIQQLRVAQVDPAEKSPELMTAGPSPSMVAGVFGFEWLDGRVGYSFLTRQHTDYRLVARDGIVVGLDQPADTLSIGGEGILEQGMGEYWAGLTWAKSLGDRYSIGTTGYGVYRSQRTRVQGLLQAFGAGGYSGSGTTVRELDCWSGRVLAKIGMLADFGKTKAGISITTPGLHVLGQGTGMLLRSVTGDVDFDGNSDAGAVVSYAEDVDAEFRSPASIALGLSYNFDILTLHATTEYFGSVDQFNVLESPVTATGPGVTSVEVEYQYAAEPVWNAGGGVEYRFSDSGTAYGAFVTDRSAFQPVDGTQIVVSTWDIYHLSGGVALTLGGTKLTLGMGYAWGGREIQRQIPPVGDLPPTVVPQDIDYSRMKFIIGFSL